MREPHQAHRGLALSLVDAHISMPTSTKPRLALLIGGSVGDADLLDGMLVDGLAHLPQAPSPRPDSAVSLVVTGSLACGWSPDAPDPVSGASHVHPELVGASTEETSLQRLCVSIRALRRDHNLMNLFCQRVVHPVLVQVCLEEGITVVERLSLRHVDAVCTLVSCSAPVLSHLDLTTERVKAHFGRTCSVHPHPMRGHMFVLLRVDHAPHCGSLRTLLVFSPMRLCADEFEDVCRRVFLMLQMFPVQTDEIDAENEPTFVSGPCCVENSAAVVFRRMASSCVDDMILTLIVQRLERVLGELVQHATINVKAEDDCEVVDNARVRTSALLDGLLLAEQLILAGSVLTCENVARTRSVPYL
jgi:hypothetical protein